MRYVQLTQLVVLMGFLGNSLFSNVPFFDYVKYKNHCQTILESKGIDIKSHSILARNCAYMLRNYISLDQLNVLKSYNAKELRQQLFTGNFWAQKLDRELSIPYSDIEYAAYFEQIQNEVNSFLHYLRFLNNDNSRFSLKIYGSMAKARFGGNSSLDILIESNDDHFLASIANSIYSRTNPNFKGNIEVITGSHDADFLMEPFQTFSSGEMTNLVRVYDEILSSYGFKLVSSKDSLQIVQQGVARANLEFNPIEDRVHYLIKQIKKLDTKATRSYDLFSQINPEGMPDLRLEYIDKITDLKQKMEQVISDLNLVINQINSERHSKIKQVTEPESYARLKSFRSKRLVKLIRTKIVLLEKKSQVLKQID